MLSRLLSLRSFIYRSAHSKCGDFLNGLSVVPLYRKAVKQCKNSASVSPAEHPWQNLFQKRNDSPVQTINPSMILPAPAYYTKWNDINAPRLTNVPSINRTVNAHETVRLCDVVAFRAATSNKIPRGHVKKNKANKSSAAASRPVIYRYVDVIKNSIALLEAIHFELFMPDRSDLRFLGVPMSSIPSGTVEGDYFRISDADLLSDPSFAVELDKYTYPVVWEAKKIQKMRFDDINEKSGLAYVLKRSENIQDEVMAVSATFQYACPIRHNLLPDEDSRREHSLVRVTSFDTSSAHLHAVELPGKDGNSGDNDKMDKTEENKDAEEQFGPRSEYLKLICDVRTSSQRSGRVISARGLSAAEAERIEDRLGGFTTFGQPGDLELMDELFRLGCRFRLIAEKDVGDSTKKENDDSIVLKSIMDTDIGSLEECRPTLNCIYGRKGVVSNLDSYVDSSLTLQSAGMQLNEAQSRAVRMYADASGPRVFCILSPPGAGKTTVAAAMAAEVARSKNEGVQLMLSPRNPTVNRIGAALKNMDYGGVLVYNMRTDLALNPNYPAPFDFFDLMGEDELNKWRTGTQSMNRVWILRSGEKETIKFKNFQECLIINKLEFDKTLHPKIILSTEMMALQKMSNSSYAMYSDFKDVNRIIIDDASLLTESSLYAIIRRFPQARIVLIGDVHQYPPFMYDEKILGHQLAGRPALTVAMKTGRVPVVELNEVYRAPPSLIAPYNRLAYGGKLFSKKPAGDRPLSEIGLIHSGMPQLLLIDVNGKQDGDDKNMMLYNEKEIETVKRLLSKFPEEWKDEVMIICLYKEQQNRLQAVLDNGYVVRSLISARGREKSIVILMTTRTEIPEEGSLFNSTERCVIAVSRQQKALVILGKESLLTTNKTWSSVVNGDDFTRLRAEDI